jgi:hypothetical protein
VQDANASPEKKRSLDVCGGHDWDQRLLKAFCLKYSFMHFSDEKEGFGLDENKRPISDLG